MPSFDIQAYAALLLRAYAVEERLRLRQRELRDHPPKTIAEYSALVTEISDLVVELKSLWDEANALIRGGDVTEADIQAAHARNQTEWPVDVPVPPPPAEGFPYGKWLTTLPHESQLHGDDHVYGRPTAASPTEWLVWERGPVNLGFPGAPTAEQLIYIV